MGEANLRKARTCRECGETYGMDAAGMRSHAKVCKRLNEEDARLIAIGLKRPGSSIVIPGGDNG